jgi:membrane protease subunit HflC
MKTIVLLIVFFVCVITLNSATFIVHEYDQAVVSQFGRIIGKPRIDAGLHWKVPFIQDAVYFDKRILQWDGEREQIPTRDKKYIWVDTTARWRISDPIKVFEKFRNQLGIRPTLDDVIDQATRDVVSTHNLVETVRNSNQILEDLERMRRDLIAQTELRGPDALIEEELSGDIERVEVGREKLSDMIKSQAMERLEPFGVELIDVQIRSISYESSVEQKVYTRMVSERNRIAEKIRSFGKGEVARIAGKRNRDLKEIESNAYREAQTIKGVAEAEASKIYASTFNQDPDFYEFSKSLDIFRNSFADKGSFILSTDSQFLKLFEKSP